MTLPRAALHPFDSRAPRAFIVTTLALAVSGIGFKAAVHQLEVYLRKAPVPLRQPLDTIPRLLDDWQARGEAELLDAAMIEELGTDKYLNRHYLFEGRNGEREGGRLLQLHLAYYTGMIDAVPHIPDRCFEAAGLQAVTLPSNDDLGLAFPGAVEDGRTNRRTGEPYTVLETVHPVTGFSDKVRLPVGDLRWRSREYSNAEHPDLRIYGGYMFIANGGTTPSPDGVRRLAFDRTDKYAYYFKVQTMGVFKGPDAREEYLELTADLLESLLPHLLRCLPDWAEVEKQQAQEAAASRGSP